MSPCYIPTHADLKCHKVTLDRREMTLTNGPGIVWFTSSSKCYMSKVHIQVCLINLKAGILNPTSSRCFLVTTQVKSQGYHIVGSLWFLHVSSYVVPAGIIKEWSGKTHTEKTVKTCLQKACSSPAGCVSGMSPPILSATIYPTHLCTPAAATHKLTGSKQPWRLQGIANTVAGSIQWYSVAWKTFWDLKCREHIPSMTLIRSL